MKANRCFKISLLLATVVTLASPSPTQAIIRELSNAIIKPLFGAVGEGLFGSHVRHASASVDNLGNSLGNIPANLRKELEPLLKELGAISKDLLKEADTITKARIEHAKDAAKELLEKARKSVLSLLKRADTICNKLVERVDQRARERILQVQATLHAAIYHFDVVLVRFLTSIDTILKERIDQIDRVVKERIAQTNTALEQRGAQAQAIFQGLAKDALTISGKVSDKSHHLLATLTNIMADIRIMGLAASFSFKHAPAIQTILPDLVFYQKKQAQEATLIIRQLVSLSVGNVRPYVKQVGVGRPQREIRLELIAADNASLRVRLPLFLTSGQYIIGLKTATGQDIVAPRLIEIRKENLLSLESKIVHINGEAKANIPLEPGILRDKEILSIITTTIPEKIQVKTAIFDQRAETGTHIEFKGVGSRTFPFSGHQFTLELRHRGEATSDQKECMKQGPTIEREFWEVNDLVAKGSASSKQKKRWSAMKDLYFLGKKVACYDVPKKTPIYGLYLTMFRLDNAIRK